MSNVIMLKWIDVCEIWQYQQTQVEMHVITERGQQMAAFIHANSYWSFLSKVNKFSKVLIWKSCNFAKFSVSDLPLVSILVLSTGCSIKSSFLSYKKNFKSKRCLNTHTPHLGLYRAETRSKMWGDHHLSTHPCGHRFSSLGNGFSVTLSCFQSPAALASL